MIRSSRWGGNRVELKSLDPGLYTLFLYVWEDNNSEVYSIQLNDRPVVQNYQSGTAGNWAKLGPWPIHLAKQGDVVITSQGGAANFSGIEVWRGNYDGLGRQLTEDEIAFFEKRIRPVLVEKCYECHSAESKELQGDLLVDSRASIRNGGTKGACVIPGDVEKSLLIQAIRYEDEEMQMPPDGKLSDAEIADLTEWIRMGAPDPRSTATKHLGKQIDVAEARQFWSLKPLSTPTIPKCNELNWIRNPIDAFVLSKMEEQQLAPSEDADKRTLLRRVTYDLIGLPPTPEEIQSFLADDSQEAYERVVDRLLDSPRYGERWGRHWLDVVRYADTAGDNSDFPIPQMYRYRDWVIDAFNRDLPYDEFIRDQIAGDLRGGNDDQQRYDRIIATGYLANSRRFGSRVDDYPQHLTIEDTIDNLGRAFLGLSLSCARCHDHKFDPITSREYYGLYGIFQSTRYPWPGIELDQRQRDMVPLVPPDQRESLEKVRSEWIEGQAKLDQEANKLREKLKNAQDSEKQELEAKVKEATKLAEEHRQKEPTFEVAYAVAEGKNRQDAAIQRKGDPTNLGDLAKRKFPAVLGGQELPEHVDMSGRVQLADWILGDQNPLTARVMVNRIWQHHFGRGIVPTPNDFGKQGKPPSHPELLDYLANEFRNQRWSIKAMHRLILLSRTYQQSSQRSQISIDQDPTNVWLSGFPRRRLDAESIRDTLLMLGGNLDLNRPSAHPFPPQHTWDFTQHKPFKATYDHHHRSVYLMTQRIQRHPFLAIFDGADPSTSTAARSSTTTPLQALYLLNDPFVHEQSERIAKQFTEAASDEELIQSTFERLFARQPDSVEVQSSLQYLHKLRRQMTATDVHRTRPMRLHPG